MELCSAVRVPCRGWDGFSDMDDSLAVILLSPTTCTGSSGHPRTELAFFISPSSLFLSATETPLPQQTRP